MVNAGWETLHGKAIPIILFICLAISISGYYSYLFDLTLERHEGL